MRGLVLTSLIFITSCGTVSDVNSAMKNKREEIKAQNIVTIADALETLNTANREDAFVYAISKQSVAQVVFPKIVKAGIAIGANYGEGFLIRDGNVVALIKLTGGNLGFQVGGQTYSQVTYILSEKRYNSLISNSRISLNGSISMAVNGRIKNSILTSDALKGDLYTVQFNETGTVFGASLESIYYSVRQHYRKPNKQ
jgi:lipid-binding SYLF domain-containing protein